MKKIYIKPNNKVYTFSNICQTVTVSPVSTDDSEEMGTDEEYGARDDSSTPTSGSSNVWDNEW